MDLRGLQPHRGQSCCRKSSNFIVSHNINSSGGFLLQPSVFELVRQPDFANLPLVVEDFVKDNGGSYTGGTLCTSHLPRRRVTNS